MDEYYTCMVKSSRNKLREDVRLREYDRYNTMYVLY